MSNTGWLSPSSTTGTHASRGSWSNASNCYSSDNSYASWTITNFAFGELYASGFSASIPTGATINGIEVSVEGYYGGDAWDACTVGLIWNDGTKISLTGESIAFTTSDTVYTKGGATSLWGGYDADGGDPPSKTNDYSVSDINDSKFAVNVVVEDYDTSSSTIYIDQIRLKVYYTEGSSTVDVNTKTASLSGKDATISAATVIDVDVKTLSLTQQSCDVANPETISIDLATLGVSAPACKVFFGEVTTWTFPRLLATVDRDSKSASWVNPEYARSPSNANTTMSIPAKNYGDWLECWDFRFNLPTDAIINGYVLRIQNRASANSTVRTHAIYSNIHQVSGVSTRGNNMSYSTYWTTTESQYTYGTSGDTWGLSLTAADVNTVNFGFVLSCENTGTSARTAEVDSFALKIYYQTEGQIVAPERYDETTRPTDYYKFTQLRSDLYLSRPRSATNLATEDKEWMGGALEQYCGQIRLDSRDPTMLQGYSSNVSTGGTSAGPLIPYSLLTSMTERFEIVVVFARYTSTGQNPGTHSSGWEQVYRKEWTSGSNFIVGAVYKWTRVQNFSQPTFTNIPMGSIYCLDFIGVDQNNPFSNFTDGTAAAASTLTFSDITETSACGKVAMTFSCMETTTARDATNLSSGWTSPFSAGGVSFTTLGDPRSARTRQANANTLGIIHHTKPLTQGNVTYTPLSIWNGVAGTAIYGIAFTLNGSDTTEYITNTLPTITLTSLDHTLVEETSTIISMDLKTLSLAQQASSIVDGTTISVDVKTLSLAQQQPYLYETFLMPISSLTLTQQEPTIAATTNISMDVKTLALSQLSMGVYQTEIISMDVKTATMTALDPTLAAPEFVDVSQKYLTLTAISPQIMFTDVVSMDVAILDVDYWNITISNPYTNWTPSGTWKTAQSATQTDYSGGVAWSNISNIYSNDDNFASTSAMPTTAGACPGSLVEGYIYTDYLIATNFGYSIPDSATVDGVAIRIRGKGTYTNGYTYNYYSPCIGQLSAGVEGYWETDFIKLYNGSGFVGTNKAGVWGWKAGRTPPMSNEEVQEEGGSTDKWGTTLSPTLINSSSFGVGFAGEIDGENSEPNKTYYLYIDSIEMAVYYTYSEQVPIDVATKALDIQAYGGITIESIVPTNITMIPATLDIASYGLNLVFDNNVGVENRLHMNILSYDHQANEGWIEIPPISQLKFLTFPVRIFSGTEDIVAITNVLDMTYTTYQYQVDATLPGPPDVVLMDRKQLIYLTFPIEDI